MQFHTITTLLSKAKLYHSIETGCVLCQRTLQESSLFASGAQVQNKCSIHKRSYNIAI